MRLSNLKSAEKRARYVAMLRKVLVRNFRPAQNTTPVFIAGMQRSGTTMLMNVFHMRRDTAVFDEARSSAVFSDFRIRSTDILRQSIESQRFPAACYKLICDSHKITDLLREFPDAKVLWMYRSPRNNADSQLKKFAEPVRAIKLVHADRPGGGWFAEGVSDEVREVVQSLDAESLSDFDWACLNWWARNILFFELGLEGDKRVRLLCYEDLVQNPRAILRDVVSWIGLPEDNRSFRFVDSRSLAEKDTPPLDPRVDALCTSLLEKFDVARGES